MKILRILILLAAFGPWISFSCLYGIDLEMPQLSKEEKEQLFDEVFQLTSENFYDTEFKGLDWSSIKNEYRKKIVSCKTYLECASMINQMLLMLNTSHTRYYTRFDQGYYHLLDIFKVVPDYKKRLDKLFEDGEISYSGIGILSKKVNNHYVITGVLEGTPAHSAGLKRGQSIIRVDEKPFHPILSFAGKSGKKITLTTQTSENKKSIKTMEIIPVRLKPDTLFLDAMEKSILVKKINGKKVAYVHLWSYSGEKYHDLLKKEIAFGKIKGADALIIDFRDGWGGANPDYINIFNTKVPVLTSISRDKKEMVMDVVWRKPVALLVNEGTRSGKEVFAYAFKKHRIGKVIGSTTAKAVMSARPFLLKDGSLLYLAARDARVDGERLEGVGVEPDIFVPSKLNDEKEDLQLKKALEVLSR